MSALLELLDHLKTGHTWHHEVEQNQIRKRVNLQHTLAF